MLPYDTTKGVCESSFRGDEIFIVVANLAGTNNQRRMKLVIKTYFSGFAKERIDILDREDHFG